MRLPFWKVQAVGNDFVLVHFDDLPDSHDKVLPDLARRVSDRKFGVGSDGLLAVGWSGDRMRMRMFNPDGTEDFCGNGLRCAAAHGVLSYSPPAGPRDEFDIEHLGRIVLARVSAGSAPHRCLVTTRIDGATFDPSMVPLASGVGELFESPIEVDGKSVVGSALSTGSTHTILFVDALPQEAEFEELGRALEHAPLFPQRTSVVWAVPASGHMSIRIWERGAGETLGCGTGASAAVAAWYRLTDGRGTTEVRSKGGIVTVAMERWDAPIDLTSEAEEVYRGVLAEP